MRTWAATEVIDGDTFRVFPGWNWRGRTGDRVRPTGYDTPEMGARGSLAAKQRLESLIRGKQVRLGNAYTIDRGRLVADVFVNGTNLSESL